MEVLASTDRLALSVLAALGAVALACGSPRACLMLAAFALVVVLVAYLGTRSRSAKITHDLAPAIFIPCMFNLVFPVALAANPRRYDATLARIDERLFGDVPRAWHELLGRPAWLTDVMSVAYMSFYLVPFLVGVALYARRRARVFHDFVFAVELAFFVPFAGYLLVPAYGPRTPNEGGAVSAAARFVLSHLEVNVLDAFPSAHTSVILVTLALGWRHFPRARAALASIACAIIFSTVYLALHYVIDLVAGAMVAALALKLRPALERALVFTASETTRPS